MRERVVFFILIGSLISLLAIGMLRNSGSAAAETAPGATATKTPEPNTATAPSMDASPTAPVGVMGTSDAGSAAPEGVATDPDASTTTASDATPEPAKLLDRPLRVASVDWELLAPGIIANNGLKPGAESLYTAAQLDVEHVIVSDLRELEAALARGGADPKGTDIAIVPLPAFVSMYERLQALEPNIFFVVGRSRGREGFALAKGVSLKKPPSKGDLIVQGSVGSPAAFLALFILQETGIDLSRVRLAAREDSTARKAKYISLERSDPLDAQDKRKLTLTTADATGLIPYVAIAPRAFVTQHPEALEAWAQGSLEGGEKLALDVPSAARTIAQAEGAPDVVVLLELLGWIRFSDLDDIVYSTGLAGRGAVTLDLLFRRSWRAWREVGGLSTPIPERVPLSMDIIKRLVRSHTLKPAMAESRKADATAAVLFVHNESKKSFTEQGVIETLGFYAGIFERSDIELRTVPRKGKGKMSTEELVSTASERYNIPLDRVRVGKNLSSKSKIYATITIRAAR